MTYYITHEFDAETQTLTVWVDYSGHLRMPRTVDGEEAILAWRMSQEADIYYTSQRGVSSIAYRLGLRSPTWRSWHHGDYAVYKLSRIED